MKLPFDLGVKLFFRLLIPGFFLTLGLLPLLFNLWDYAGWSITTEYTLILSVILMGWLIVSLDLPIYMVFEGRRGWPRSLRSLFLSLERRRLKKIISKQEKYQKTDRPKYLEATVEKRKFPINKEGQYEALLPTRLGNSITAYESYPDSRYGMDSIFYWYRIWLALDKDLKEEIDNRAALADSAVYTSFALFVSSLFWLTYAILSVSQVTTIKYLPRPAISWSVFLFFLISGYLIYRMSVIIHNQFGEVFKSVFDIHGKDVDVSQVVNEVSIITHNPSLLNSSRREQLKTAWRYLHNYRVKCPLCGEIIAPSEVSSHNATSHKAAALPVSNASTNAVPLTPSAVSQPSASADLTDEKISTKEDIG